MYFPVVGEMNWHLIGLLHGYAPSFTVINSKGFVFVHSVFAVRYLSTEQHLYLIK